MTQVNQVKYELLGDVNTTSKKSVKTSYIIAVVLLFVVCSTLLMYTCWLCIKHTQKVSLNSDSERGNSVLAGTVQNRLKLYEAVTWNNYSYGDVFIAPVNISNASQEFKPGNENMKLVCYYTVPENISSTEELMPEQLDPWLCTHIIVAFARVRNCSLYPNKPDDVETYKRVINLKQLNPELKVMLCIGGESEGGFSDMVASHRNRKIFINKTFSFISMYPFDGIDLDWEFPAWESKQIERRQFSYLLHDFRKEIKEKKPHLLLSVAVAAPKPVIDLAYDIPRLAEYADFISIMAYDYHFYQKLLPITGLNAPLYAQTGDKGYFTTLNTNWSVNYWEYKGMPRNKIVVGLPTYGHSFTLVNPVNNGLRAPSSGIGSLGSSGFVSYFEVCKFLKSTAVTVKFDDSGKSPFAFKDTEWISYDDERSLALKTEYVLNGGYAGAMVLSLSVDDYNGTCSSVNKTFPLTRHIKQVLKDDEL